MKYKKIIEETKEASFAGFIIWLQVIGGIISMAGLVGGWVFKYIHKFGDLLTNYSIKLEK